MRFFSVSAEIGEVSFDNTMKIYVSRIVILCITIHNQIHKFDLISQFFNSLDKVVKRGKC